MYKFDFIGDEYINKREVLDVSDSQSDIGGGNNMTEDTMGNLYAGKYQTPWDTEIFVSRDGGDLADKL